MALPSTGAISMSMINTELGQSTSTTLDLEDASQALGDTSTPYSFSELYGASTSRTQIAVQYLFFNPSAPGDPNTNNGWPSDGELVLCAENSTTGLDTIIEQGAWTSTTEYEYIDDATISDGDIVYAGSIGSTLTALRSYLDGYFVETTQNVIFDLVTATGAVTGKRSRTPDIPTKPTLVADSSTQITVTIPTTNTQVTRTFKLQRSINSGAYSDLATILPSASGSSTNTSVNTTYVDSTGISAGDVVKYKVRGQNNFNNSDFSQESNTVTTPTGTSISYSNVTSIGAIGVGTGGTETFYSDDSPTAMSISITGGVGTTSISKSDNITSATTFAWSTSGDPMDIGGTRDTTGTSNGGSGWVSSATGISGNTIYIRLRVIEAVRDINESGTMTISTTNNSVTEDQACNISISNFP
jgi:hypothetical protein